MVYIDVGVALLGEIGYLTRMVRMTQMDADLVIL